MAIYTRTGDKGKTSLRNGKRVSKNDFKIEVLGAIDELNSLIGVVLSEIQNSKSKNQNYKSKLRSELILIQKDLLEIGSSLANPSLMENLQGEASLSFKEKTKESENFIDEITEQMPRLGNFILPGGGKTGSMLHLARAVCRRVERKIVGLNNKERMDKSIIIYFNRLSDLLFTMARFANFREKRKEQIWHKNG